MTLIFDLLLLVKKGGEIKFYKFIAAEDNYFEVVKFSWNCQQATMIP